MIRNPNPFLDSPKLIFLGTYHNMGTVWLTSVLETVAACWKLCSRISNVQEEVVGPGTEIIFASNSQLGLDSFGNFVGSHMIRDRRGCVVSGYFYHLWTKEAWAHEPQAWLVGLSYQKHLKSLNQEGGLTAEIDHFAAYESNYRLRDWRYDDDRIFGIKCEELLAN